MLLEVPERCLDQPSTHAQTACSGSVISQNIAPHLRPSGKAKTLGTTAPTSRPSRSATSVCGGGEKKAFSGREKASPARDLAAPVSSSRIRRSEIAGGLVASSSIVEPFPYERR